MPTNKIVALGFAVVIVGIGIGNHTVFVGEDFEAVKRAALTLLSRPHKEAIKTARQKVVGKIEESCSRDENGKISVLTCSHIIESRSILGKPISNQDLATVYNNRGVGFERLGLHNRAISDFDKAQLLNPKNPDILMNRAVALQEIGQYERAIADYDKVLKLNPKHFTAYNNRGTIYIDLSQYERAIADFNMAIQLNTKYADAYSNRGTVYIIQGQYDLAIQDYDKALQLNPRNADIHKNRGIALLLKGQSNNTIADFRKALKNYPSHEKAKYNNNLLGFEV